MAATRVSPTSLFLLTTVSALVVVLSYSRYEVARLNEKVAKLNKELDSALPLRELEINYNHDLTYARLTASRISRRLVPENAP